MDTVDTFVDIFVEYPSGITVSDRAIYMRGIEQVCASERLQLVMRNLSESEAPPLLTAQIEGKSVSLVQRIDGDFNLVDELAPPEVKKVGARVIPGFLKAWGKDQRQQFGRYMHTLSAASLAGAVGYWHSTGGWTITAVFNLAALVGVGVVLFFIGIASMNGE